MSNDKIGIREVEGCMQVVGLVCVSLAIGVLYGAAYGWLAFGVCMLVLSFI